MTDEVKELNKMNKIMNYFSQQFGAKNLSHYPELYVKTNRDLNYTIALSTSAVFYDDHTSQRTLDLHSL
jgi:hypothetical protein